MLGAGGDIFAAILPHDDYILYAHAEPAGEIDAGLRRADDPCLQGTLVGDTAAGILVNLQANAVAVAVAKVGAVARVGDDFSAAPSTSLPVTPALVAAMPISWARSTVS